MRATTGGGARTGGKRRRAGHGNVAGPPTPRQRTGVFGAPQRADAPITRAQQQAATRVDKAKRKLPKRQFPHVPIVQDPTPAQTRAATKRLAQGVTQQVGGGGSGADKLRRREQIYREIERDPRYARYRKAIRHYSLASQVQDAVKWGNALGVKSREAPYGNPHLVDQARWDRLMAGSEALGRRNARDRVSRGRMPTRIQVAGLGITPAAISRAVNAVTSLDNASPENAFFKNTARDVANLGAAPFVGAYTLGSAAVRDILAGPTGLTRDQHTAGATGDLLKGVAEGTAYTFTHPEESFRKSPVTTISTLLGGVGAAGRVSGALARGLGSQAERGGLRGALARGGSTVRPPLALTSEPGGPIHERTYSKDLTRKAAQVMQDSMREPLRDAEGKVVTVKQRGRTVPVLKASYREREGGMTVNRGGLLGQQADFEASRANSGERLAREQAATATHVPNRVEAAAGRAFDKAKRLVTREANAYVRDKGIKGRHARDVVLLVAGGTIRSARTFRDDLTKYRDDVAAALQVHHDDPANTPYLHKGEVEAAQRNLKLADTMLERTRNDPELVSRIVKTGEDLGRHLNSKEEELLGAGAMTSAKRAERARVIHAAVTHQDARHFRADELAALERTGQSVRHPEREAAWREARTAAKDAVTARRTAEKKVRDLEKKRSRLVGAQASRRGRRGMEGKDRAATKQERVKLQRIDAQIKAARAEVATQRKASAEAKRKLQGTPRPPIQAALRHPDGRFLSTEEIHAKLTEGGRDPSTVAYVPNASQGGRAFHTRFDQNRPVMDKAGTRTGSQYAKGATETSVDILKEHGVKQATTLNKARAIDRLVGESGVTHPSGRLFTWKEAQELVDRAEVDTRNGIPVVMMRDGERMVPMRAHAANLSDEASRIIEEDLQGPGAMEILHLHLLNDRFLFSDAPEFAKLRKGAAENVVLVPAKKIEQLQAHLRPAGQLEKLAQAANRPFRMAVLPQPRWLTGNFVEPYVVRLTINGSGLNVFGLANDWRAAGKALKAMERSGDPKMRQAAHEIRAHQFGGLFVGGRGATIRRGLEDFPKLERLYGKMVSRLPVTHQAAQLAAMGLRTALLPLDAFFRVNRVIEQGAQRAAFGHQFRKDLQEFTGSWTATLRLQQKAVEEAAQGLVNTPTQQRFMREQHKMLGKYEGYGPLLRAVIQGPMPFLPWALNAARFVYWTVPAEHTVLTAVLMQVNDLVAKDWEEIHKPVAGLKGNLKYAIPNGRGGWVDIARYTPWGLSTPVLGGDVGGLLGQFAPQFQGAVKAAGGQDPFGRDLSYDPATNADPKGTALQHFAQAIYSLGEATVPYASTVRRLREGGGTPYAGSRLWDPSVKPGTGYMSAARRTFDPFRPTYLSAPTSKAAKQTKAQVDVLESALDNIAVEDSRMDEMNAAIDRALEEISIP